MAVVVVLQGALKMRDWKMRDWNYREQETYGTPHERKALKSAPNKGVCSQTINVTAETSEHRVIPAQVKVK